MKNYYKILNIEENASPEEIKIQYRKLARQYHPDLHSDNEYKFYENKMKELNEAAETLLDEEKRKEYDNILFSKIEESKRINVSSQKTYNKNSEYKKTHSDESIKKMIIYFTILSLISISIILIGLYVCFIEPLEKTSNNIPDYLDFGLTRSEVVLLLGEPIDETKHLMIYDDYQIIIYLNKVDGWLDANNTLNVGPQKELSVNDIKPGDKIINIINKYGNPDTYSVELAIYNNIILYLEDSVITNIEIIDKKSD